MALNHFKLPIKGLLRSSLVKQSAVCSCKYLQTDVNPTYTVDIGDHVNKKPPTIHLFKTAENNPANHEIRHEGLIYKIPARAYRKISSDKTFHFYRDQVRTFNEACLVIRKPAIEIIHMMNHLDPNVPIPKVLLYGRVGCGKSQTLLHILHYAAANKWFIVQTPWHQEWTFWLTEVSNSSHKPGRIDLPVRAKEFLQHIMKQNGTILNEHKTQFRYQWTKRESSEVGTRLMDLAKFGISRVKFADDVVGAIFKEVKQLAQQGKFKVLVAIDGINGFYGPTQLKTNKKSFKDTPQASQSESFLPNDDLTLVVNMKKLLHHDMVNSVCVATVDSNAAPKGADRTLVTPSQLLGKEGFKALDPFIPINVPTYSEKEALSMLEYFMDRKYIINQKGMTEEGLKQLMFLSGNNPRELYKICLGL